MSKLEQKVADMEPWLKDIDHKLDQLVAAANMGKGAWWAVLKIGGLLVLVGSAAAWILDRFRP